MAFLSSRGGKPQIHLIRLDGGEAEALTESKTGVQSFEWSPSGKLIAFSAEEPKTEQEEEKEKKKDDAVVVDRDDRLARLWVIDVDPSGSMAAGSKTLAFIGQTSTRLPELWVGAGGEPAREVTTLNKEWSGVPVVEPEVFQYAASDGLPIEAAVSWFEEKLPGSTPGG